MSTCAAAWLWTGSDVSRGHLADSERNCRWRRGNWCWRGVEASSCASIRKRQTSSAWLSVRHIFAACLMHSAKHQDPVTNKNSYLYTGCITRTQESKELHPAVLHQPSIKTQRKHSVKPLTNTDLPGAPRCTHSRPLYFLKMQIRLVQEIKNEL